jgi:membrane protein
MLLIWVYYSSQIVLLGAEFTQVYARRRGLRSDHAASGRLQQPNTPDDVTAAQRSAVG